LEELLLLDLKSGVKNDRRKQIDEEKFLIKLEYVRA
jgi:hypothetical protein